MAHELDMTIGRAAVAFRGVTPWHGLGETIQPDDTLDTIQHKAGLEYTVERTPVLYDCQSVNIAGIPPANNIMTIKDRDVLYRSDTKDALSVVSNRYEIVQPSDIIAFYKDLVEQYGFQIEVAGALKQGRKVWALANTHNAINIDDEDKVNGYLLLATSYDGTMATQARFTSVRVVCNNTLTAAVNQGKATVTVPHSTKFDANKVKLDLNIGENWNEFGRAAKAFAKYAVSKEQSLNFLIQTYYECKASGLDEAQEKGLTKFLDRMANHLFNSPGAKLASANGTLWGLINAVTHDIDFGQRRSDDIRLDRAWFGDGERIKQRAMQNALELI